jgi:flagellar motility protein MotE (MotC chaperone)
VKIGNIFRRLRLIPAVMVLGGALLVVKGAGLAHDAQAQEQQGVPATTAPATGQTTPDPAGEDDADTSSAQVDVLTSLKKRRAELDGRERDLDMRENLIAAAEKRVDGKIDNLKQLQTQIQTLLMQRDANEQKQLDGLVKTYSSMKPKDAARIFDSLDGEVLLSVSGQMKPDVLGAIMSQMQAEAAQKLTVRLANRLRLPDTEALVPAVSQQLAATVPATGTAPVPSAATPVSTTPSPTNAKTAPAPSASQQAPGK